MKRGYLIGQAIEHYLYVEDLEMIVYLGGFIAVALLVYGSYSFIKRWTRNGQKLAFDNLGRRLRNALYYGLLQRKVIKHPYAGVMHSLIYVGMAGLFASTALRFLDFHPITGSRILVGDVYLWYKLAANVWSILVTVGVLMALYRRMVKSTKDLPNTIYDNLVLLGLLVVVVTGFFLDSISTMAYRTEWIGPYDPIGTLMIPLFSGMTPEFLSAFYRTTWVIHMLLVFIGIAILPYSKLSHILIGAFLNTFFSRDESPSHPQATPDLIDHIEAEGTLGVQNATETDWKQRMDFDSCISCARCHNVCPANLSGKALSPMDVMLDMRKLLKSGEWEKQVWPDHVHVDAIWSCVMCGACVEECPLLIDQAETLMELRRGVYFEEAHVSREIQLISNNIMKRGNPYGFSSSEKEPWLQELLEKDLCELAEENEEYDYLLWIGCVTSFDPQLRKSTESLLRLLKKAGHRTAVLAEEQCCGDPARRVGDELMFFEAVTMNKEILEGYKYRKLITSCPHCYNSFKNEYKGYGYEPDVEHSTETLSKLLQEGKLNPGNSLDLTITFHDSCYLGRWNKIYKAPRDLINAIPGVKLIEMERNHEKAFCCGGGGGQLFYEVEEGERISKMRIEEAEKTGASAIVVACPYCNTMFAGENSKLEIMDINQLLDKSVN